MPILPSGGGVSKRVEWCRRFIPLPHPPTKALPERVREERARVSVCLTAMSSRTDGGRLSRHARRVRAARDPVSRTREKIGFPSTGTRGAKKETTAAAATRALLRLLARTCRHEGGRPGRRRGRASETRRVRCERSPSTTTATSPGAAKSDDRVVHVPNPWVPAAATYASDRLTSEREGEQAASASTISGRKKVGFSSSSRAAVITA